MINVELLIEKIKTLPVNRIEQVLDFVEFIRQRESQKANANRVNREEVSNITIKQHNLKTVDVDFDEETITAFEKSNVLKHEEFQDIHSKLNDEMWIDLEDDDN